MSLRRDVTGVEPSRGVDALLETWPLASVSTGR
jgi:hypothetical protein